MPDASSVVDRRIQAHEKETIMNSRIPVTHAAVIGQLAFEQAARDLNGRRVARKARRRRAGR